MRRPRAKGLLTAFFSALFVAAMAFWASTMGQFGFSKDTERISDDATQFLSSAFYAHGFAGGEKPVGQDKISVFYLDEAGLQRLAPLWVGYPPSYDNDAAMVSDIAGGAGTNDAGQANPAPRAVFVDFIFLAKGRDLKAYGDFHDTLARITGAERWSSQPACLADEVVKLACMRATPGAAPIILAGDKHAAVAPSEDARDDLLAVAAMADVVVNTRKYPMLGASGQKNDSPAALLLAADCLAQPAGCADATDFSTVMNDANRLLQTGDSAAGQDALKAAARIRGKLEGVFDVRWSDRQSTGPTGTEALSQAVYGQPSKCKGATSTNPIAYTFGDLFGRIGGKLTPARLFKAAANPNAKIACPYDLSLSYADFINTGLSPAFRQRMFSDKLVFIGGQFANSNDWASTPVHGEVAGVHLHAMALDNLLEYRAIDRTPPRVTNNTVLFGRFIGACLIFLLAFLGGIHRIERNDYGYHFDHELHHKATPQDKLRRARHLGLMYLRFFATNILVIVLALIVCMYLQFPMNWILIIGVVSGKSLYSVRKIIGKDLKPLTDALPWNRALKWIEERLSLEHEIMHEPRRKRRHKSAEPHPASPTSPHVQETSP